MTLITYDRRLAMSTRSRALRAKRCMRLAYTLLGAAVCLASFALILSLPLIAAYASS